MESIYKSSKEKNIDLNSLLYLLLCISNQLVTGDKNNMYVKKVEISHLKGKCMMAAYPSIKKIAINFSSIKFLYGPLNERLFFLLGFFHECRHFMQTQQYENETDLINKFYLYLYTSGASHLNDYDDENHYYYYNEIDAHLYALNMANKFKNIGISNENIERIRKMYISECVTNIEYSEERRTHYYFNNQESEMTIGQIELYKSLMFRNKKKWEFHNYFYN